MELQVGTTIWSQIPLTTKMAVGAREPLLIRSGVEFRAGRELRIQVVLDASDTYKVTAYRLKRKTHERIVLEEHTEVYAENLGEIIYHAVNK